MPIFITQGRFTSQAIAGMTMRPEDRSDAVRKLAKRAGCRLIDYYFTYGNYDFLVITEAPDEETFAAMLVAVCASGTVEDVRPALAFTTAAAKHVYARAAELTEAYKPAGDVE